MSANEHITIGKNKTLPQGQDYYLLRSEGLSLVQKLGSKLWTDYNIHDPGITILEALCYAITDLTYRSSYDVKDLLAVERPGVLNTDEQTFFTAREILTTAPWTVNDYRKYLIDLDGIKNSWVKCSLCNCGPKLYVDCKESTLTYTKPKPPENPKKHEVVPKGLYDVLLEFDADNENGDLNTGKIKASTGMVVNGESQTLFYEVRFDSLRVFSEKNATLFKYFVTNNPQIKTLKAYDLKDKDGILITNDAKMKSSLRRGLYISFDIKFTDNKTATLKDVPLHFVWLADGVRGALTLADVINILSDPKKSGVIARYIRKIQTTNTILNKAKKALHMRRNITEDFCCIDEVEVEEVGICTDMELMPDADIEQVLAEAYYLVSEYINPSIKFYTLSEMLEHKTVDQIFDGPKLKHGFVDEEDLEKTVLNRTLYASDIIQLLMGIEGVVAVKNFVLVRFDKFGDIKESDPWKLELTPNMLPRLYIEGSKVLAFKNGLPFLPDIFELMDTMNVVYGNHSAPKLQETDIDIPIPEGGYHNFGEYYPVQYSLPQVYGTGADGLPSSATELRQVQAKQLKAYLLFFEQLLVNYTGQLSNMRDLFSISNTVNRTYFPTLLKESDIVGVNDLYDGLDEIALYAITETEEEYGIRRNKFLDHLLSRFSESFAEYALLLYSYDEQSKVKTDRLIKTKTSFLKQFPYQSAYKAQSFDYTVTDNIEIRKDLSGIHHRIATLLGISPSLNYFDYDIVKVDDKFTTTLTLIDHDGNTLLESTTIFSEEDRDDLVKAVNFNISSVLALAQDKLNYHIMPDGGEFKIELGSPGIAYQTGFATNIEADDAVTALAEFAQANLVDENFMIVEHILLRPRNVNDAVLDICVEPDCEFCGNEDPYSYALTFVFNGESDIAQENFAFRRYAEKTIREEIPAHIICKICWVKEDVYNSFEAAYVNWLKNVYETPEPTDECKTQSGVNNNPLKNLVCEFNKLKSIYPPATLHDCVDGDDENRVFLNQTNL